MVRNVVSLGRAPGSAAILGASPIDAENVVESRNRGGHWLVEPALTTAWKGQRRSRCGTGCRDASRFETSKPAAFQHLTVWENAEIAISAKRSQYVNYKLVPESLTNTLNAYVQKVCPVSRPLKLTSAKTSLHNRPD